jgi:hypothetical protein
MAERENLGPSGPASPPAWTAISLRRSGQRPLRFEGALAVAARMPATDDRLGHTIRLFETSNGEMAVSMELWTQGCDVPTADARMIRTAEELVQACESFDPRERMSMDFGRTQSGDGQGGIATKVAIESHLEATEADYRATVLAILRDPRTQTAAAHAPPNI